MRATWKGWAGALTVALALTAAGCGKPCDNVKCNAGFECDSSSGKCVSSCPAGEGWDTGAQKCQNLCDAHAVTCSASEKCDPTSGKCVNAGCSSTQAWDPAEKQCRPACEVSGCSATQSCDDASGQCQNNCTSPTQPRGKAACEAGFKCDPTSGACVTLCTHVACSDGQYCDATSGQCASDPAPTGYPGSACTKDSDCAIPNDATDTFSCMTSVPLNNGTSMDFPGGFCVADPSCTGDAQCPQGDTCLPGFGCIPSCVADSDCRNTNEQYRCQSLGSGTYACLPASQCVPPSGQTACGGPGDPCQKDSDCVSGATCYGEMMTDPNTGKASYTGFVGGYCFWAEHKGDTCPSGSQAVPLDPTDPNFYGCLKDCTVGDISACRLSESCYAASSTANAPGVCWAAVCSGDQDCQQATCTAQSTSSCGKGQTCTNGTCPTADKCTKDSDCCAITDPTSGSCVAPGTCDTASHTCQQQFCDPSLGFCSADCRSVANDDFSSGGDTTGSCAGANCPKGTYCDKSLPAGSNCLNPLCSQGTTCNPTTGHCDRTCTDDSNCGVNGVCENPTTHPNAGTCIAHCTKYNESEVCASGTVCNYDTGHCQAKCTDDASCNANGTTGAYCDTASGHCLRRCDAATDPATCPSTAYCDTSTGQCQTKCTSSNESVVCSQTTYCQTSTGKCLPNCVGDTSECVGPAGAEACDVQGTDASNNPYGKCGLVCTNDLGCGKDPSGTQLTCLTAPDNASLKRCQEPPAG